MKSILVIGLGRFGRHLCRKFMSLNNEVMIVDRDEAADGSCARNASKEVHRPNRLRRSTTAPIR